MTRPETPDPDPVTALLAAAVTARLAAQLGAPRLATAAARQAAALADQAVIALSAAVAATPAEREDERIADVRTTGDLAALLAPSHDDTEEVAA
jgi:hypothetical protein